MPDNPLLAAWLGPDEVPPFGRIAPGHFRPAFERAMAEQRAALARIAHNNLCQIDRTSLMCNIQ